MIARNSIFVPIAKFRLLSWRDRVLLANALVWLAGARAAILVLPFKTVAQMASRSVVRPAPLGPGREACVERVRWAITVLARRVPWRAKCYEQGIAAFFMLRRRGVPAELYYGAANIEGEGLCAHVWVRDGDAYVVCGEIAHQFAVLAKFPSSAADE